MKPNSVSTPLNRSLVNRKFSHIYIEEQAQEFASTQRIRVKFPDARIVVIRDYKAVFNRHNQRFQTQKASMKLILAVKKHSFIYSRSPYAPNFGEPHFYYNAMILNCIYNCDYCYLQGMYTSGNVVVFVNQDAFFNAATDVLKEKGSIYLCISYDTDLLAFENIIPNCRHWINWAEKHEKTLIEIRTKSANFNAIADIPTPQHTILAWTLSPESVIQDYEKKTPPLSARLVSIKNAVTAGWKVRLCFDPVLRTKDWKSIYQDLIDEVLWVIPGKRIFDFSIGVFRMNSSYLDRIREDRSDSSVLYYPFTKHNQITTYSETETLEIASFLEFCIRKHHANAKIFVI